MFRFNHLNKVKQNYFEHFFDAISYSCMAFKASCYFFVHSLWPDWFEFDGSKQIEKLNTILQHKKNMLNIKF